jgi:sRNA-binding protein
MTMKVCRGRVSTLRGVCRPALIAVASVTLLLSGCSKEASPPAGAQAKPVATQTQGQRDTSRPQATQATTTVDAQKLKDDAAKAAEAKTAATNAAVAKAAKSSKAKTAIKRCSEYVSAGPNTSCAFAESVYIGMAMPTTRWDRKTRVSRAFDVYSPTTGGSYKVTCKLGGTIVCRGGKDAVVYLAGSNPGQDQYVN